jgi:hypothetical protein
MAKYELDEVENKRANAFIKKHEKKCRKDKHLLYSYVFTPTGIGIAVKIICPYCGEEKDITNVDCW